MVLALTTLGLNLFVPGLRTRRRIAGIFSRAFLRGACIPFTVEELRPAAAAAVRGRRQSRELHRRHRRGRRAAAGLRLRHQEGNGPRAAGLAAAAAARVLNSSNASTVTRAQRMHVACCVSPPPASRWCSFPRAPSTDIGRSAVHGRRLCDRRPLRHAGGRGGHAWHARRSCRRAACASIVIGGPIALKSWRRSSPGAGATAAQPRVDRRTGRAKPLAP